jgi:glycerate 2-kinase
LDKLTHIGNRARGIFSSVIVEAQRRQSALLPIELDGSNPASTNEGSPLDVIHNGSVYAIAIGKAAFDMAAALDQKLGSKITAGLIVVPESMYRRTSRMEGWRTLAAGHPLPNQESLAAAQAAFALLEQADREKALVIFLISGGGSALVEWPSDERITLEDLREANRLLISCGATIGEVNAVRRSFSAVKGGGLAARAPQANNMTLIVSDVNRGEESNVASGPTLAPPLNAPDAREVVERYQLVTSLPPSVMEALGEVSTSPVLQLPQNTSHVVIDNQWVIEAAAKRVRAQGVPVEIATDVCEQPIVEGCELLLEHVNSLVEQSRKHGKPAGLISGGEFSCPVRGSGIGGRNLETTLRCAIALDQRRSKLSTELSSVDDSPHIVFLSAGTDGIDGNSEVAGAVADETTIARGRSLGLDAHEFLNNSDAFNYFRALGDTVVTFPTGTNVRDVRIMLVSA